MSDAPDSLRFRRQWILSKRADAPGGLTGSIALSGGYRLYHNRETRLGMAGHAESGVIVLGTAVDPACPEGIEARLFTAWRSGEESLCRAVVPVVGVYVVVAYSKESLCILTDPGAMLGIYARDGEFASTPSLFEKLERDESIDRVFRFGGTDDWYPGSLTPFRGVRAILANHAVDVIKGTSRRFWPMEEPAALTYEEGLGRAASLIRSSMERLPSKGNVLLSLTGGYDSRVNLAAAKQILDRVECFTIVDEHVKACDREVPMALASRFGLRHRCIENREPGDDFLRLYQEIGAGLSAGGRLRVIGACEQLAEPGNIHVNGNLGAITKSFYWPNDSPRSVSIGVLAKEFAQRPACIHDGLEEWLGSVPPMSPTTVYNLMYLEQRGGRWMGIGETASQLFYDSFTPFCSREVFECVCGMPRASQRNGLILRGLVEVLWPDLLEVPYCRAVRRWTKFVPRGIKNRIRGKSPC